MTKILNNNSSLSRGLYGQILDQMNTRLLRGIPKIKQTVASNVSFQIWNDSTTAELLSGGTSRLVSVLGLNDASSRIDDVVQAITNNIHIDFKKFRMVTGGRVSGRFNIGVLNIADVLKIPSATIISKNGEYSWLEMLVVGGDRTYGFDMSWLMKTDRTFPSSRTEHGLIVPHSGARLIRIPAEFSGTPKDNWLTRALYKDEFFSQIEQTILSIIS